MLAGHVCQRSTHEAETLVHMRVSREEQPADDLSTLGLAIGTRRGPFLCSMAQPACAVG